MKKTLDKSGRLCYNKDTKGEEINFNPSPLNLRLETWEMTYYIKHWMEDEEMETTAVGLATMTENAKQNGLEIVLVNATATELHFVAYDKE